jgi:predicted amidohydrolase YtcJ
MPHLAHATESRADATADAATPKTPLAAPADPAAAGTSLAAVTTTRRPPRTRRAFADLAIVGADVLTPDPARPRASAVAVAGGRITAVGDDAEVRARSDARTELVDGTGMCIVPGLTDAHLHPLWATDLARGADCLGVRTRDELRAILRAERERLGPAAVVRAFGVDYALYGGHDLDGAELEADAGGPAIVQFFDVHTRLATPSVMRAAGVTEPVAFADGSEIVFRGGAPTGELREFSAFRRVDERLPHPTPAEERAQIVDVLRRLNAQGLAAAHVMDGKPATYDLLRELEASGDLTLRLVVPLWVEPETTEAEQERWLGLRDDRGRLWRGGVAKFFADGVVETGTAWLEEPDARGGGTESFWPDPARLREAIARFAGAGFQCVTHAIGDAAQRFTLDAYRDAGAAPGVRHRLEHAETLPDELLARYAAEGVVLSMQPLHGQWRSPARDDEWTLRLGPERAARAWRTADVLRSGAIVPLGSDWPVAQSDPRLGLAYAIQRRLPGDAPDRALDAAQGIDPLAALHGYTTHAAAAVSEEHEAGRIAPGLRADLTAFAGDPTRIAPDDLPELPVRLVAVDGRVVHRN